jgi:hypothetical protein
MVDGGMVDAQVALGAEEGDRGEKQESQVRNAEAVDQPRRAMIGGEEEQWESVPQRTLSLPRDPPHPVLSCCCPPFRTSPTNSPCIYTRSIPCIVYNSLISLFSYLDVKIPRFCPTINPFTPGGVHSTGVNLPQ